MRILHLSAAGHGDDPARRWPVMLFLHGGGERGDGLADLDWVLVHGPLAEAWLQRRDLPFIILSPQLPLFVRVEQVAMRGDLVRPDPFAEELQPRPKPDRPPRPMARAVDSTPSICGTWRRPIPTAGRPSLPSAVAATRQQSAPWLPRTRRYGSSTAAATRSSRSSGHTAWPPRSRRPVTQACA